MRVSKLLAILARLTDEEKRKVLEEFYALHPKK